MSLYRDRLLRGAIFALLGASIIACTRSIEGPAPLPTLLSPMFGVCIEALAPPNHFELNREKPVDWDDGILVVDDHAFDLYVGLHPPVPARAADAASLPVDAFVRVAGSSDEATGVLFASRMDELPAPLYVMVKPQPGVPLTKTPMVDGLAARLSYCVRSEWD